MLLDSDSGGYVLPDYADKLYCTGNENSLSQCLRAGDYRSCLYFAGVRCGKNNCTLRIHAELFCAYFNVYLLHCTEILESYSLDCRV